MDDTVDVHMYRDFYTSPRRRASFILPSAFLSVMSEDITHPFESTSAGGATFILRWTSWFSVGRGF